MLPWEIIGREHAPDGAELVLYHRNGEFMIRVGGHELMSSRAHGSEERMATLATERLDGPAARVLVGGLGLGYTVRAVLDAMPTCQVTVAEIVPAVIAWNRGPLADLAGRPLDDPRVVIAETDVGALLKQTKLRFDAILLDVDNGPAALTRKANQALYGETGLALSKRALRRGGILAVWSASEDARFEKRLTRAGFRAESIAVPARGNAGGPKHTIFVARAIN